MRSKRYGFITFESKESVEKALKPGTVHVVDGKVFINFQNRSEIPISNLDLFLFKTLDVKRAYKKANEGG